MKPECSEKNLIWMDLEMTGLDINNDKILEVAIVPTDQNLNPLHEGCSFVVNYTEDIIEQMDEWCQENHAKSGLIQDCLDSKLSHRTVEKMSMEYCLKYVPSRKTPLCGNSIFHDKTFLRNNMKSLHDIFHYRLIDVSGLKELSRYWYPDFPRYEKKNTHRALHDIYESINELKYYKEKLFVLDPNNTN